MDAFLRELKSVLESFKENDILSVADIIKKYSFSYRKVHNILDFLAGNELIERVGKGKYKLKYKGYKILGLLDKIFSYEAVPYIIDYNLDFIKPNVGIFSSLNISDKEIKGYLEDYLRKNNITTYHDIIFRLLNRETISTYELYSLLSKLNKLFREYGFHHIFLTSLLAKNISPNLQSLLSKGLISIAPFKEPSVTFFSEEITNKVSLYNMDCIILDLSSFNFCKEACKYKSIIISNVSELEFLIKEYTQYLSSNWSIIIGKKLLADKDLQKLLRDIYLAFSKRHFKILLSEKGEVSTFGIKFNEEEMYHLYFPVEFDLSILDMYPINFIYNIVEEIRQLYDFFTRFLKINYKILIRMKNMPNMNIDKLNNLINYIQSINNLDIGFSKDLDNLLYSKLYNLVKNIRFSSYPVLSKMIFSLENLKRMFTIFYKSTNVMPIISLSYKGL